MTTINQLLMTFLLNACWQIAVIAGVAALSDRLLRNATSRHRHILWVTALGLAFVVPALASTWLLRDSFVSPAVPATVVERQNLGLLSSTAVGDSQLVDPATPFILRLGATL